MKAVNISLDPKILDPETPAAMRAKAYGATLDCYSVVVPTPATVTVKLSDSTTIYGISGANKVVQLYHIYKKLVALIRSDRCDVISSTDFYYIGFVTIFLAKRYHLGVEVSVLGIEKLTPVRKRIARYVLRSASVVRALSNRIKKRLIEEFGVPEGHIRVISIFVPVENLGLNVHGLSDVELQEFERLSRGFKEKYDEYTNFLTVSRLVPIKRIELQLRAVARLKETYPDIRLHIVGDGPLEEKLRSESKKLGLDEHVIFHGRQTGLALGMFYRECDCFLLTSDYEGWGMVIIEAATAGLPIIMTSVGLAGEFTKDGESGLIIPVDDEDALVAAMERILTDKELRETLSLGTKKSIASLQSFEEIIAEYRENWEQALAHRL